ncbi:MAG: hypothetical protein RL662_1864 [Bacteroidota bacterium]|jgi:hydrogenase maturation factor
MEKLQKNKQTGGKNNKVQRRNSNSKNMLQSPKKKIDVSKIKKPRKIKYIAVGMYLLLLSGFGIKAYAEEKIQQDISKEEILKSTKREIDTETIDFQLNRSIRNKDIIYLRELEKNE